MKKILLIDDDEPTNFLNGIIIRQANCAEELVVNSSAKEALEYLEDARKSGVLPDLILLDLNMPIMNGWDFLKQYEKLELEGVKLIVLTSSINPVDKERAAEIEKIDGFKSKPLSRDMLEDILSAHFTKN